MEPSADSPPNTNDDPQHSHNSYSRTSHNSYYVPDYNHNNLYYNSSSSNYNTPNYKSHTFVYDNLSNAVSQANDNTTVQDEDVHQVSKLDVLSEDLGAWRDVREELTWALPCHTYGLACLFIMLSFYTFCSILNLRSQVTGRPFMSSINAFLCILGVTRASCFLADPYRTDQTAPALALGLLWDAGYPCVMAAFSLVQHAFTSLTQVEFHPKWLLRGASVRLMIGTHFAFVAIADVITAFHTDLQAVSWGVQVVFLLWGALLSTAFLYGGARLLSLLRALPNSAFAGEQGENNKGILQLALLAQCNNIASSVLTAAAPSLLTPRIRITDEYERTFSYGSSGASGRESHLRGDDVCSRDTAIYSKKRAQDPSSDNNCSTTVQKEKSSPTESQPDNNGSPESPLERTCPTNSFNGKVRSREVRQSCTSSSSSGPQLSPVLPSPGLSSPLRTPRTGADVQLDETGVFCFDESARDLNSKDERDKFVAPGAEPTGDAYVDEFVIPKIICSIEETLEDEISLSNKDELLLEEIPSPKRKKSITWSEDLPPDLSTFENASKGSDYDVNNGLRSPNRLESDGVKTRSSSSLTCGDHGQRRRKSSTLSTAPGRKGSYTSEELLRKGSLGSGASSRRNSSVSDSPSRKSSLSSTSRKGSVCSTSVRKGSTCSYTSNRKGSSSSVVSSRKCSLSSRKGSADWDAQSRGSNISRETQERINRCLDTTEKASSTKFNPVSEVPKPRPRPSITPSCRSSRRNTLVNAPANVELDSLVAANASEPPGDLTLSCILNHIAFVNQTEISAKMGARLKESRKEQVKQVLIVTYITALFGAVLSLLLLIGLYLYSGGSALSRPLHTPSFSASTSSGIFTGSGPAQPIAPWPWFAYVCCCRLLELAMGCAMANITRQSVNRHPQYAYPLRMKHGLKMYV